MRKNEFILQVDLLNHLLNLAIEEQLADDHIPLTFEQYNFMVKLWEDDGISQQELADRMNRNRASTTRMIDTLYIKGLLERKAHPTDKRQNLIFLTKKGHSIKGKAHSSVKHATSKAMNHLNKKEVVKLNHLLEKIILNLQ